MKLYPSSVPVKGQPGGAAITGSEREVFKLFKQIAVPGATTFHSLRFLEAGLRPFGEADFVVVSPKGIFVFEVKGGAVRKNEDGAWVIGSEDGKHYKAKESPLEQAARNSMSIRDWLESRVNFDVRAIPVGHAAILPYQSGSVKGLDVVPEIVASKRDCADAQKFERWVNGCIDYWWRKKQFSVDALSAKDVENVAELLRGKFEVEPAFDLVTGKMLELQDTLAPEQVRILDAADQLPRIIVTGGAGSGKSFVIRTLARRYLEEGVNVGILVPRSELKLLYPGIEEMGGRLIVGSLEGEPVQMLLVDEGQDLCNEVGMALIDRCVAGGLAAGNWRIFLDENIQASLRGLWSETEYELLKLYAAGTVLHLADNYRNTDKIVTKILLAVPAKMGRPQVSAGEACLQFEEGPDRVASLVKRLHDRGAKWAQICVVVVGDNAETERALAAEGVPWRASLSGDGVLVASSEFVQGLEYPHVVIYLGGPRDAKTSARFYVAASRARVTLAIVDPTGIYSKLVEGNL